MSFDDQIPLARRAVSSVSETNQSDHSFQVPIEKRTADKHKNTGTEKHTQKHKGT